MKSAIMQPYFFPYFGYFQLISKVDLFVLYGNVSFRKKSYISRNSIVNSYGDNEAISLEIKKSSSFKKINELELNNSDWRKKLIKKIDVYYGRYPYYYEVREIVVKAILRPFDNLSDFNAYAIKEICKKLEVKSKIMYNDIFFNDIEVSLEDEISISNKQDRVIMMCKKIGSNSYVNPIGGVSLYSREHFEKNEMNLNFFISSIQGSPKTNQDMNSVIHFLMKNGLDQANSMLGGGELI